MNPHRPDACPSCGKKGTKHVNVDMVSTVALSAVLSCKSTREFWRRHRAVQGLLLLLIALDVVLGLALLAEVAAVVGIILGLLGYFLGPYAVIKVREIRSGSS